MTRWLAAVAAVALVLAACGGPSGHPVFVGAGAEPVDCVDGAPGCVRISGEVDGARPGTGSCILYATTGPGRVAVAASGELNLVPDSKIEWIVRVPSHFDEWDPVCTPTAEG